MTLSHIPLRDKIFMEFLVPRTFLEKVVAHSVKRWTVEFLFPRDTWVSSYLDFPIIQYTSYPTFLLPRGEKNVEAGLYLPSGDPVSSPLFLGQSKIVALGRLFVNITLKTLTKKWLNAP